jgi:hypothetical protein
MEYYFFIISHPQIGTPALSLVAATSEEEAESFLTKALSKSEHPVFNPALYNFNSMGSISFEAINSLFPGDIRIWTKDMLEP